MSVQFNSLSHLTLLRSLSSSLSSPYLIAATTALLILSSTARSADLDRNVAFNIPAQPLESALIALSKQANVQIVIAQDATRGARAPTLSGKMPTGAALTELLDASGLRYQRVGDTVTIAPVEANRNELAASDGFARYEEMSSNDGSTAAFSGPSNDYPPGQRSNTDEVRPVILEEVVVTGSHIRGAENKTNPVIVIDRGQIDRSGYSTTQDLFRSLPQNFASGDATEDGIFSGNARAGVNTEAASGVNLRGLGVSSTLVLVNGHRLAPSAFGTVVDVSLIPLAAIERIEILTDGSSAIYGSDAVGGVVNIILKTNYQGADTSVRYGSVTEGDRTDTQIAQTIGANWGGGNATAALQYQKQTALAASDRDFSSDLTTPNELLPRARTYSATVSGQQKVADRVELHADALLSKREFGRATSLSEGDATRVSALNGNTSAISVAPGMRFAFTPQWSAEFNAMYGRLKTHAFTGVSDPTQGAITYSADSEFTERSADLAVDGHWNASSAGDIGIAFGGSYRDEDAKAGEVDTPGATTSKRERRHVTAYYGELYIPVVGAANHVPMIDTLSLSAAVRTDRYSDFGSTTNPRVGMSWTPLAGVSIRASYGKSFRAPNAYEESTVGQTYLATFPFGNPGGAGVIPAFLLGGTADLKPERARTEDFGIEFRPAAIQGLSVTLGYYDIKYDDRIITPPFQTNVLQQPGIYGQLVHPVATDADARSIRDAVVAGGGQFIPFFGDGSGVRYLYDDRQQNAAIVRQSGLDFSSNFIRVFGTHTFTANLNTTFTDKIDTAFSQGASYTNLVNTLSNPTKWRARVDLSWASKGWSVGGAVNSVSNYVNTAAVGEPKIASWETVDLNAQINVGAYLHADTWDQLSVALIVLNALDRDPPYVSAPSVLPVNYDPANSNPLGRFIALELRKHW